MPAPIERADSPSTQLRETNEAVFGSLALHGVDKARQQLTPPYVHRVLEATEMFSSETGTLEALDRTSNRTLPALLRQHAPVISVFSTLGHAA